MFHTGAQAAGAGGLHHRPQQRPGARRGRQIGSAGIGIDCNPILGESYWEKVESSLESYTLHREIPHGRILFITRGCYYLH